MRFPRFSGAAALVALVAACGTTYSIPEAGAAHTEAAAMKFAQAKAQGGGRQLNAKSAEQRFSRVAARVEPMGRKYCEALTADRADFNCAVQVEIDREMDVRNAYFTYEEGQPVIRLSMPLLQDTASDDEAAFVMSHEYGHLIGRHVEKQRQQAVAGAILVGVIAGAAAADADLFDANIINLGVGVGAAAGTFAYSQAYELESDTLGARIAHAAGYDPAAGAEFFARPEEARTGAGKLSFWGTHPPDKKRYATVLATVDQIEAQIGLQKVE